MKEWVHDTRQEQIAAKHAALAGVDGADQIAHREVLRRVQAWVPDVASARNRNDAALGAGVAVLAEAVDAAVVEWDPCVYVGSVAAGVVRALRDLGVVAP